MNFNFIYFDYRDRGLLDLRSPFVTLCGEGASQAGFHTTQSPRLYMMASAMRTGVFDDLAMKRYV